MIETEGKKVSLKKGALDEKIEMGIQQAFHEVLQNLRELKLTLLFLLLIVCINCI